MPSMTPKQFDTILQQLGGGAKLKSMFGATDFMYGEDGENLPYMGFKLKGHPKINYVSITLVPDNTYTVRFGKLGRYEFKTSKEYSMVHANDIRNVFETTTGLHLSL